MLSGSPWEACCAFTASIWEFVTCNCNPWNSLTGFKHLKVLSNQSLAFELNGHNEASDLPSKDPKDDAQISMDRVRQIGPPAYI